MPDQERMRALYRRYLDNDLSGEELNEFLQMFHAADSETSLNQLMDTTWYDMFEVKEREKVIPIAKSRWYTRMAVAATILVVLGTGIYLLFFNRNPQKDLVNGKPSVTQDIPAPEKNIASITLADGRKIFLDSAGNGALATEGTVNIEKSATGEIIYNSSNPVATDPIVLTYNTLSNPRGSKVVLLVLADGTKVWLNSESSLRYPAVFAGQQRRVQVTGEAYFEVAKNAAMPFVVQKESTEIQVLGTHFNVNAYDDEDAVRITLLEGSIRVTQGAERGMPQSVILKPGQQALVTTNLQTTNQVNLDEVMAWKQGWFHFENADLKTILRQFARWYNIEVLYEGELSNEKYFSIISRNTALADVLKSLQANKIQFRIEGKKLYVTGD